MCLAVPLRIRSLHGKEAVAERDGVGRTIRVDFLKDPKEGDYVLVHAGFAIEKVEEAQAMEDIAAWHELEEALRAI